MMFRIEILYTVTNSIDGTPVKETLSKLLEAMLCSIILLSLEVNADASRSDEQGCLIVDIVNYIMIIPLDQLGSVHIRASIIRAK